MHLLALIAILAAPAPPSPALSEDPFPPHRIADGLYYVGSRGLASYLVTTKKGHILINPSFESTVPVIRASIEKLGFKITDVKILLNSHAHDDHVAGMALARELSGADVYVMRGDDQVIASGGAGQYQYQSRWKPDPGQAGAGGRGQGHPGRCHPDRAQDARPHPRLHHLDHEGPR